LKEKSQYDSDVDKLAGLVKDLVGIPKSRTTKFIKETGASELFSGSYAICETDSQRIKLLTLRDFMYTLETVRDNQADQEYFLNSSLKAKDYFKSFFSGLNDREYFAAAFMDIRFRVISSKILFSGSIFESPIFLRELIKEAIFQNSTKLLVSHNHPGGSLTASADDLQSTLAIQENLCQIDVDLVDHIIIARGKTVSMAELGLFKPAQMNYTIDAGNKARENADKKTSLRGRLESAKKRVMEQPQNKRDKALRNELACASFKKPVRDNGREH